MDDIFAGRLMSVALHTVATETSVREAAKTMLDHDIGSVLVVDEDGRLEGILTTTDFVEVVAENSPNDESTVGEHMSTDVITATAQDPIRDIADAMVEHGFHHVPVVDDADQVIGILTSSDLTAYLSHIQTPSPAP